MRNGFSPNTVACVNSAEEGLELAAEGKAISFLHSEMRMEGLERKYHVKFLDIDEKEVNLAFAVVFQERNSKRLLQTLIEALGLKARNDSANESLSKRRNSERVRRKI